ncbi:MAG: 6-bladed beta-propeller [Cytophagales bacterium]|nr:6-bladed beta-propeller [Cytophagales bacterium]
MNRLHIYLIAGLLFAAAACQPKSSDEELMVDFTKEYDSISVDLGDIAENIRLVRLDTSGGNYLSGFYGYIGEKYIINVGCYSKINLFTASGKFVKNIAVRGKGPDEFMQIDAWAVDDKENYFVFHDNGKNYIKRFNLESLILEKNIPFENHGWLSGMTFLNDTTLAFHPGRFADYGYLYFCQSVSGKILFGVKKEKEERKKLGYGGFSPIFKKAKDSTFLLQSFLSDSVFLFSGNKKRKLMSFVNPVSKKINGVTHQNSASILHMTRKNYYLKKGEVRVRISKKSVSLEGSSNSICQMDRSGHSVKIISKVHLPVLGITISDPKLDFHENNKVSIYKSAAAFKDILEQSLENEKLSEEQRAKLAKLNASISEDDNPILIVGDLK